MRNVILMYIFERHGGNCQKTIHCVALTFHLKFSADIIWIQFVRLLKCWPQWYKSILLLLEKNLYRLFHYLTVTTVICAFKCAKNVFLQVIFADTSQPQTRIQTCAYAWVRRLSAKPAASKASSRGSSWNRRTLWTIAMYRIFVC